MKYFVIISAVLIGFRSLAQGDTTINRYFDNDSISYSLRLYSPSVSTVKKDPIMKFYVSLPMTRLQKMELIKFDTTFWLRHLSAEKSDWATNLVLYYLFKKDAAVFVSIHKKRQQWLKLKQDDIDYWQNLFRKMDYNNASIKKREKLLMIE